ncbi:GRIP and coiled-coil domain-containing protein 2-like [Diprion similis]|uniref:GRIP and coiled-coil domain-containing protein 2-like n=1 Tax=Diprion similis TaxID=362088 RepID=UPI001EF7DB4C|nr:GRIP and coiled-coil domain-containing protein 2-like [Diprion similis]
MENESPKVDNSEASKSTSVASETSAKPEEKESLEERYNKFRVYAVKLRHKVSDLTELLQKSEAEKNKIISDKEELQNRIIQISDNAKKLQTIQSEYDKVQDNLEQAKDENKKLSKNLETLCMDNSSLKEALYEKKNTITRLTAEVDRFTKEQSRLETLVKQCQDTIKALKDERKAEIMIREQKDKEYEEMKTSLNLEKEAHKTTKAKLEATKQECNTKSVLSLEVQNYEKSVEDLKAKLENESSKRNSMQKTVDKHLETISNLEMQISELKDTCLAKANQITVLGEKNEAIKQEMCEIKRKADDEKKIMDKLNNELRTLSQEKDELSTKINKLMSELDIAINDRQNQKRQCDGQIKTLESEITRLNAVIARGNQELEALHEEFTGYKLRAQSVLRTKQSQGKDGGRSTVEVEEELEHARTHAALLRDKLDYYTLQIENLRREIAVVEEERNHAIQNEKECNQKISMLHQELSSVTEQLRSSANKIQQMERQHKEEIDSMQTKHKHEIFALEEKHHEEFQNMQMEKQKMMLEGSNDTTINQNYSDKYVEHYSELEHDSRSSGIPLLEREEGEGSESVDSSSSVVVNTEKHRKQPLMSLDELLNSPDDYHTTVMPPLSLTVDRQTYEVCERRVKHLTVLLADAERDIAKLTQLNQLLKEDIRTQQRSIEREKHGNNFEYLKNIVFKFITLKNGDERSHLIPVLNTILKLSPEETQKLNAVAGVSGRNWIPGIPIPGWNHY